MCGGTFLSCLTRHDPSSSLYIGWRGVRLESFGFCRFVACMFLLFIFWQSSVNATPGQSSRSSRVLSLFSNDSLLASHGVVYSKLLFGRTFLFQPFTTKFQRKSMCKYVLSLQVIMVT